MQIIYQQEQQFFQDFLPLIIELECGTHFDASNPQHADWLKRRIAWFYQGGGHAICLYDDDGSPVGFLFLIHDPGLEGVCCFGKKGTIAMLGLLPAYRSQGIGVRLIEEAERYLKEHGGECLYVDTYAMNTGAIRFYTRQGFTPIAYHLGENGVRDKGQVVLYKELI